MFKMLLGTMLAVAVAIPAQADVNVFTDHQVIYMAQHGVNSNVDVPFPTGKVPYLGRIGVEYEEGNWSYQLSYIHRSNADITRGNEYNYNGVSVGVKYKHCIYKC